MTVRFSASAAPRLMACPASANLELAIKGWVAPVVDHTAGAKGKGSEIHEMFDATAGLSSTDLRHFIDSLEYYYSVRSLRRFKELSEVSVVADWLQTKPSTKVDRVLYLSDELHVFDWKTGKIPVNVAGNEQLLYYAACFIHLAPKAKGVWIHVVQPWANNVEGVYVSATELAMFMVDAKAAEQRIIDKDVTFGPSDHCTFCPANPMSRGDKGSPLCPAMMQLYYPQHELDEAALMADD